MNLLNPATLALIAALGLWAIFACRASRSTPIRLAIVAFAAFHAAILLGSTARPEPAGGDPLTLASTLFAAAIVPLSLVALLLSAIASKAISWSRSRLARTA